MGLTASSNFRIATDRRRCRFCVDARNQIGTMLRTKCRVLQYRHGRRDISQSIWRIANDGLQCPNLVRDNRWHVFRIAAWTRRSDVRDSRVDSVCDHDAICKQHHTITTNNLELVKSCDHQT